VKELKSRGKTIFMTSHILPEVEAVCDRIGIIVDGEMRICGNVDELVDQYTRRQGFRLKLRVKELDEPHVRESLRLVPGISNVVRNDGFYLIDSGTDVSEDVSRAVCRTGGVVTELEVYRPSLNEIFLDITRPVKA
jgi:ABC-2 type transport system ATP-binding protein